MIKDFILNNYQFYLILFLWTITGFFFPPASFILIILSIVLFKYKNYYSELLIGFFIILIFSDNRAPMFSFAQQIKPVYLIILAALLLLDRRKFQPYNRLFLPFIFFFIYSLLLLFRSETPVISIQKTLSYILLFLTVPNFLIKAIREDETRFIKLLIYTVSFLLLSGLLLFPIYPELTFLAGRFRGLLGNPNGLGLFCNLFFILFYLIGHHRPGIFQKNEKIIIYLLIGTSVIFSGSRNSIITIALFLFFHRFFKLSPMLGFILVLLSVLLYEVVLNSLPTIIEALNLSEYFRRESLEGASGRYVAWAFAWKHIQNDFFLGKGFAYDEYLFNKNYMKLSMMGHQGGVHSTYISFWLNTGLTGLILFFGALFYRFLAAAKNSDLAYPVLFAILFSITFESWLIASLNPFTIQFLFILTLLSSKEFIRRSSFPKA